MIYSAYSTDYTLGDALVDFLKGIPMEPGEFVSRIFASENVRAQPESQWVRAPIDKDTLEKNPKWKVARGMRDLQVHTTVLAKDSRSVITRLWEMNDDGDPVMIAQDVEKGWR